MKFLSIKLLFFPHLKGVKKVRSALHHRILNHLIEEMMLKNCIFNEPVIPCDTL